MLAAFAVLLFGVAFADVGGATTTPGSTGKAADTASESEITEGGNVTQVTLASNQSTEKWAAFYGNVTGNLLLQQGSTGSPVYVWEWNPTSGGEVCVNVNPGTFTWSALEVAAKSAIDTAWNFATGDADSATSTFTDASAAYDFAGIGSGTTTGVIDDQTWQTFAIEDASGATTKPDLAFCVNMSTTKGFAVNASVKGAYQLMAATNETAATYETYYFFVELN
jgi:hypothetical protein